MRDFRARHRTLGTLLPRGTPILWLALAILVLMSLPLFALFASMMGDRGRLRSAVLAAQRAAVDPGTREALVALRAAAEEGASSHAALAGLAQGAVPWPTLLERVAPPATSGVRLAGLTQQGARIEVRAVAESEASLSAYEARLRGSPLFHSAALQRGLAQAGAISFTVTLQVQGYTP